MKRKNEKLVILAVLLGIVFGGCATTPIPILKPWDHIHHGTTLDAPNGYSIISNFYTESGIDYIFLQRFRLDGKRLQLAKDGKYKQALIPAGTHTVSIETFESMATVKWETDHRVGNEIHTYHYYINVGSSITFDFEEGKSYEIYLRIPVVQYDENGQMYTTPKNTVYEIKDGKLFTYTAVIIKEKKEPEKTSPVKTDGRKSLVGTRWFNTMLETTIVFTDALHWEEPNDPKNTGGTYAISERILTLRRTIPVPESKAFIISGNALIDAETGDIIYTKVQ